jgi:hypothetical protein
MSTPGDYRAMAEECFRWAQHAQTEDKRQAILMWPGRGWRLPPVKIAVPPLRRQPCGRSIRSIEVHWLKFCEMQINLTASVSRGSPGPKLARINFNEPKDSRASATLLAPGRFLLAIDGKALAWTAPHGQAIHWFAD